MVTTCSDPLPADLAAAHAVILAQREMLTIARSEVTVSRLELERYKLLLAKARREQFGQSSERGKQLIEQLELAIEDLEETQAEVETKAEMAAPEAAKEKRARTPRPPRKPLPDNLPVERIVEPPPCACGKCGSERLHKLGEVVSKTLECEPRRWKIIEHVREKFSCRDCEAITEAPAPSHPIPRGFAGPSLLAMVLVNKFLLHQPLNRRSKTYAREGIEIDVSTLADRVGACVVALKGSNWIARRSAIGLAGPASTLRRSPITCENTWPRRIACSWTKPRRRCSIRDDAQPRRASSGRWRAMIVAMVVKVLRLFCSAMHRAAAVSMPSDSCRASADGSCNATAMRATIG